MEEGSMVRGQPIVLDTGEYLLPLYNEKGDDREFTDSSSVSYFLRYNPKTQEWTESKNRIRSPEGNLQAQVVQISATDLFCFMRRGGGYGPTEDGWMLRSDSKDGGFSWTDAVRTDFPNPNSAVELIKLKNGHLLLVYNDSMSDRTPLTLAVSTDNGETWPFRRMIAGGDNDFAYPYAIQGSDDKIYLIYTTNSRTSIMLAVFDERAVTEYEP
jgi:predicted neuraminidase